MTDWKHDDLAEDLASHLRANSDRMVWTDMQMGPSGSPRPDVFTLAKSYSRPMATSYECKISRADFLSDCNAAKWQKYLAFSAGVIFAVPVGLITKAEVPPGAGLIVRHDAVWRMVKAPRWGKYELAGDVAMKLLIDGVDRARSQPYRSRSASEYRAEETLRARLGEQMAKAVRAVVSDLQMADYYRKETVEARKTLDAVKAEAAGIRKIARDEGLREGERHSRAALDRLCEVLGLSPDTSMRSLCMAIIRQSDKLSRDSVVRGLESSIDQIRRTLDHAETLRVKAESKKPTRTA